MDNQGTRRTLLDPRAVFAFVVLISSMAVAFRQALWLLPYLLVALITAVCMKTGFAALFYKLRRLWATILMVAVLQGIFNPSGQVLLHIGPVSILTSGGLSTAAAVVERLAILIVGGAMLSRYQPRVLVQALIQLRLPYELAYMISIGIRFIPLIAQQLRDSLTAIQLRGIDFDALRFSQRIKIYTYLLLPTVAGAVHSASQLAIAMELRGFRAHRGRSSYLTLRFTGRDRWFFLYVLLLAALSAAALILLYRS